ncbi:putative Ig domain-containing protein [Phycicoccus sp. M110.8]|uniref:RCC1 domain-containing protein n=1 Tax=Phycicoccus sp. M110.8 TaxID=3075433 RepID=UPI0028FD8A86|nr:putative Ig domain-containing protein [Phycicoccus sp. M110.8]MDU0314710.1 putative Ig domain-containing protein [Phycicoccus sp. M110.8]
MLDTRKLSGQTVDGKFARIGAIAGGTFKTVTVTGRGGVPAGGVGAVVLNVTAVLPTKAGYVTAFPAGEKVPNASNLNVRAGEVSPNLVTVKVGSGGAVGIFVSAGSSDVLADVAGYFPTGSSYTPLSPARLMDTRSTGATVDGQGSRTGAVAGGTTRDLQITGRYGIPTSGVGAVVLNVTGVAPTRATFATVWPTGSTKPNASNLNLAAGEVKPNLVIAKLGSGGKVSFAVGSGSMDLLADVAGWIPASSSYTPLAPARLLDTRATGATVDGAGQRTGAVGPGGTVDVQVNGRAGIPATGVAAVVLNVTGVAPTATTFVTAYPAGEPQPNASNLNLARGEIRPNLVIAKVGSNGKVRLFNKSGTVDLLTDVAGWFAAPPTSSPVTVTTSSPMPGAVAGTAYSQPLAASGGLGPYTWSLAGGALPAGLSLSSAGIIAGTPSAAGTSTFTVTAKDASTPQQIGSATLTITVVAAPLSVTTASLPGGTVSTAYSQTLAASGGTKPYTWTVVQGAVPSGLTLSTAGVLSGTPTAAGSATFTVQVTGGGTATKQLSLQIAQAGLSITTSAQLPSATLNQPYSLALKAQGGSGPYTWSAPNSGLPAGLTLSDTGTITGTPISGGTTSFTLKVTDSTSPTAQTATLAATLTVTVPPVVIGPATLPDATVEKKYFQRIETTGGAAPQWACRVIISSGALPNGILLDYDGDGFLLDGRPTTAGSTSFTVRADCGGTVATKSYTIKVVDAPLTIETQELAWSFVSSQYDASLSAFGGTSPYTWTVSSGSLPSSMALDATTGQLSGMTPDTYTEVQFTAAVKDATGATASRSYRIFVNELSVEAPSQNTTVGLAATVLKPRAWGTSPYAWTTTGTLPPGLTVNGATGVVSGTATQAGTYAFTVGVADATGLRGGAPVTVKVYPTGTAVGITTASVPNGQAGAAYTASLVSSGGNPPMSWDVAAGALPDGLFLSQTDTCCWQLEGSPTTPGTYTFTLRATDDGQAAATKAYSMTVAPAPLAVTTTSVPPAAVGSRYDTRLSATGGVKPYAWSLTSGALPPGLTLSGDGQITGTPTASGSVTVTVKVTDSGARASTRSLNLLVNAPATATAVSVGQSHSCAVVGGKVRCWGSNWSGELGTGTTAESSSTPREVVGLANVTQVSAGDSFTCARTSDGKAYCWGANLYGQLGDGTTTDRTVPVPVPLSGVSQVSAGSAHACAVAAGGAVWCWGFNELGQVGTGSLSARVLVPTQVAGLSGVTKVSAGASSTCVSGPSGAVKCWGSNGNGELGNGTFDDSLVPVTALASGATDLETDDGTSCAATADGAVSCWGTGFSETPTAVSGVSGAGSVSVSNASACAQTSTGALCWGQPGSGTRGDGNWYDGAAGPTAVTGVSGTIARTISVGYHNACVVVTGGSVRCWGGDDDGQLGDGLSAVSLTPSPVTGIGSGASSLGSGDSGSCAVVGGTVKCWGSNSNGELGNGTRFTLGLVPVTVSGLANATQVAVGANFRCARRGTGTVSCWGQNWYSQLGTSTGDFSALPVDVPGVTDAQRLVAGREHACVLRSGGTVSCWGSGWAGQLGDGNAVDSPDPVAVPGLTSVTSLAAAGYFTCAVSGGNVWCWGSNDAGQLGTAPGNQANTPQKVPGLTGVTSVAAGDDYACAVLSSGGMKCWGSNFDGQLGAGDEVEHVGPVTVSDITTATQVSLGSSTSCARLSDGTVRCWGTAYNGLLGDEAISSRSTPGTLTGISSAVEVSVGSSAACVRLSSGAVQCWGTSYSGELGNGTSQVYAVPQRVSGL